MNVSELCLTSPSAIKLPPLPLPPSHDIANDYLPSPIKSDSSSNTSSASGLTPGHLQPLQHPPPSLYTTQAGQQHYQQQPQLPPPPTAHHHLLPPAQSPQDGTVAAELQLLIDKCQLLCERLQHDNQSSLPPSLSAGDASSSPIHMAHDLLHGLRQLHQKEQEEIDANEMEYELIRQSRSWKENRRPKYRRRSKKSTVGQQCHSCHTSETPEWRRGPDGARTLCNACGLHYSKLLRKDSSRVSSLKLIRGPRPGDDAHSPTAPLANATPLPLTSYHSPSPSPVSHNASSSSLPSNLYFYPRVGPAPPSSSSASTTLLSSPYPVQHHASSSNSSSSAFTPHS